MKLLTEAERNRGVIAASAGNHAQGVAYAATQLGIHCRIVMPETAPKAKKKSTEDYGVEVRLSGDNFNEAYEAAKTMAQQTGECLIEAFDDDQVIAGQGTVGLEIAQELPKENLEMVLVPAGGGGILAGTCIAIATIYPNCQIIAIQSQENAALVHSINALRGDPDATPIRSKARPSIADGTKVERAGDKPWEVLKGFRQQLDGVSVSEAAIQGAIFFLFEKSRLLVEGAGALGVAALLSGAVKPPPNSTVAVVLTGGNIDITKVASVIESQLAIENRYTSFCIQLEDSPGRLQRTLAYLTEKKINILDIRRIRAPVGISHSMVKLELVVETDGKGDAQTVFNHLSEVASRTGEFEVRMA